MLPLKSLMKWTWMLAVAGLLSSALLSQVSFAAAVKVCKKLKEGEVMDEAKDQGKDRKVFCTITPRLGSVGDYVEIKNQYNYIVAIGRVIKQGKASTVVVLSKYQKDEGSMAGYPALLRINENQDYWTASNAPF